MKPVKQQARTIMLEWLRTANEQRNTALSIKTPYRKWGAINNAKLLFTLFRMNLLKRFLFRVVGLLKQEIYDGCIHWKALLVLYM